METSLETTRVEDLLAHAEWLRRLAGRLVGPNDLEDLLQETWKAALRSPPRGEPEDARPWLARVLRNLTHNRWRSQTRAQRTVDALPESPQVPSTDELLDNARTERRLADLVLTLDEPYRSTILLRYYEGKSAAQIAAALGIPAGTVRWRLSEAIGRLRGKLDDEHGGDRARWRALLLPIAHLPMTLAPGAALLASKKLIGVMALGLTLLVAGAASWLRPTPPAGAPLGTAVELAVADRSPLVGFLASAASLASAGAAEVEGVVLDPEGRPAGGARVALSTVGHADIAARGAPVRASGDGRFRFGDVTSGRYVATATDDRWAGAFSAPFVLAPGGRHRITLRLQAGGQPIEGQILDEGGGAIPGARVRAELGYPWSGPGAARGFEAVADAQGRYRLLLEPREYTLRARADGYAEASITAAVDQPLRRDVQLQPAAGVAGQVIDGRTRQPVADARVQLTTSPLGSGSSLAGRTDREGRFQFGGVLAGTYQVHAASGRNAGVGPPLSVAALQDVEGIVVELAEGLDLAGRITDGQGAGIGGVDVAVQSGDLLLAGTRTSTRTTTDGAYRLAGLLPGSYRLSVDGGDVGYAGQERVVQLASGPAARQDVSLAPAPRLTGRVLGVDGRAARGVLVRLQPQDGSGQGPGVEPTVTDEEGRFALVLTDSGPMLLTCWDRGQGIARVPVELAPAARDRHFEVRLVQGASIGGRVRYEDGAPAAGIGVAVTLQEGTTSYDSASTAPDGSFEVRNLAPGRYTVLARRKAGPWNLWTSREEPNLELVEVGASERKGGVTLVLPRGGHQIAGVVLLADGSPAAGSRLIARVDDGETWKPSGPTLEHAATAGEDGRFVLPDLEKAKFIVWATYPGLPEALQQGIAADREDVVMEFAAAARIAGSVRDSAGNPVTDFTVVLVPAPGDNLTREQQLARRMGLREAQRVRAADGRFSIDALEPGTYEVRIASPQGSNASRVVAVKAGARTHDVDVVLQSGVTVTGKVADWKSGTPLASAEVQAELAGQRIDTQTDASGQFTLPGVPAGEIFELEVRARDEAFVPEQQEIAVPAGARTLHVGTVRLLAAPDWRQRWESSGRVGIGGAFRDGRIVLRGVPPESAAARAGLTAGDVVLAVDGRSIEGMGLGAATYTFSRPPGAKLSLSVLTARGEKKTVELVAEK